MNKSDLKVGDVIKFHDWGVGGFLFGIIVEHEDDLYCSKLNIWRPKDIYFLQAHGIDNIELIASEKDVKEYVKEYEMEDFLDLIKGAQEKGISYKLNMNHRLVSWNLSTDGRVSNW